jgi:predicted SprT family Zn-dependent metalloprotease
MKLTEAQELAVSLMDKHSLLDKGWYFEYDNAKRRFGCCYYYQRKITLSSVLCELNKEKDVRDVILHEIAHALVGPGHGHSDIWRSKAIEIGCSGFRCKSERTHEGYVRTPSKYIATCNTCGTNTFRNRLPKRQVSCGKCSNRFNPDLILVYVVNHNKISK